MSGPKLLLNTSKKMNIFKNVTFRSTPNFGKCMSTCLPEDTETHTGQKFAADDYRLARFVDRPKHVNPNFAIDLIAEVPPKACKERVIACDGGGGPIGHPKVYINLDRPGNHSCGYCGLRFYLDHHH